MSIYKQFYTVFPLFVQCLVFLFVPFVAADGQQYLHSIHLPPKRVAVIGEVELSLIKKPSMANRDTGAGSAGTSTAYYLRQLAEDARIPTEITIFERESYIGGRSTTVDVFGNPSYPVELGASIFVHENTNLVNATRDLGLRIKGSSSRSTQKRQESKSEDDADSLGIWDGTQFVYSVKDSFNWWEIGKLVWRYGLSPFRAQSAMKNTIQKFKEMYHAPIFPFQSLTVAVGKTGLLNTMASSGAGFLQKNGVSDSFAREIIQSSTRVNYGQNLPLIHGVETMVCLAAEGAMSIQGGNWQIFEGMVASSGANLRLNTSVTSIERDTTKGTVTLKTDNESSNRNSLEDDSLTFDEVVIAGPLQYSGLSISPPLDHTPDEIPYVKLHVTLFASPHLLDPKFFGLDANAHAPSTVLTTLPKDVDLGSSRAGVGPAGFWSISTLDTIIPSPNDASNNTQKQYVYKIFSPERVTATFMSEILGLQLESPPTFASANSNGSIADLPKEDITWFHEKIWNTYPFEYPRVTFEDPVVAPNVWYTSGIESFISTMETSSLMGRNVAALIVDGWQRKLFFV